MVEGKVITIIGRRGQGKTMLAYAFFDYAKQPSIFINPRQTPEIFKIYKTFCSLDVLISTYPKSAYQKFVITLQNDLDYRKVFSSLKLLKNMNVFIDEMSLWTNQYKVEDSIRFLVSYTRTQNLNLILVAQRPQQLNPLVMSQTDLIITFNIQNLRDLEYLNTSYGEDFDICRTLQKLQFYAFGDITALTQL